MCKTYQGIGLKCASHMVSKTHKSIPTKVPRSREISSYAFDKMQILGSSEKIPNFKKDQNHRNYCGFE